jgi:hypothetical protein
MPVTMWSSPTNMSCGQPIAATILLSTIVHGLTAGLALERVTGETPAKAQAEADAEDEREEPLEGEPARG